MKYEWGTLKRKPKKREGIKSDKGRTREEMEEEEDEEDNEKEKKKKKKKSC